MEKHTNYYEFLQQNWLYAFCTWKRMSKRGNTLLAMVYDEAMKGLENEMCRLVPAEEVSTWTELFFNN